MNDSAIPDQNPRPQVSVHVLIYNGSWERVRATLNSVIMQKGIDFEVIVMDDCSKVNHSDRIKDFFSRHNFTNYRLINHEKNLGTVKTCLEAAELSRAEYTRGLGQGDMFFDEYALRDSYNFMVETDAEVIATKCVSYHTLSNPVKIFAHNRWPQNIKAYNDPDELRESYLIHNDKALGATIMYKRDILVEYLSELVDGKVKYLEDHMIYLMVFDKRRVKFFDRNVIYYEAGAGISLVAGPTPYRTDKMSVAITYDIFNVEAMLIERCKNSPSKFSDRLLVLLNKNLVKKTRWEARQKLKIRLGIAAIPLVLLWNVYKWIKANVFNKGKNFIMTDVNVSTDFANICMNRE